MITYETGVLVTPGMAKRFLDLNHEDNRNEKRSKVVAYARDMKSDNWDSDTGETLKFDVNGNMIDGANRMRAVVLADVPVRFDISRGHPTSAMRVMDTGAPRSSSDTLKMVGATGRGRNAAIVRWTILWDAGYFAGTGGSLHPTHSEIVTRYLSEQGAYDSATTRATDCQNRGLGTGAAVGVAHYLFYRINKEETHQFFDQYVSGANLPDLSPILALRNKMLRLKVDRISRPEQLGYIVRAWNGWRKSEPMARLVLTSSGPLTNENFPKPK